MSVSLESEKAEGETRNEIKYIILFQFAGVYGVVEKKY